MRLRFLHRAWKARLRDQRREVRAVLEVLRPGDVGVDAGAYKGAYLYWLRRAVGPAGRVFAYEPQPNLARYLQEVCSVMRWGNVTIRNAALSDAAGVKRLNVPGTGDSPGASLEPAVAEAGPCHSYECAATTLDQELQGAGRIALLKVDVEGHELRVFRGGIATLSQFAPVILVECEARHLTTHSMQDVFSFLRGFGYTGAFFCPQGLRPLQEFDPEVHQRRDSERFWDAPGYVNNFLFKASSPAR